jgi:hypothetical protein
MPLRTQLRPELHAKFIYYRELHFPATRIESELVKAGLNNDELETLRRFFLLEKKKERHRWGLTLTVSGSVLLVVGFILTAVLYHQGSPIEAVMYGFTALGLMMLLIGVYLLF